MNSLLENGLKYLRINVYDAYVISSFVSFISNFQSTDLYTFIELNVNTLLCFCP